MRSPELLLLPRVIRQRDAPGYLGMTRALFNREVRPQLTVIPIGARSIGYDRLELDAWLDYYKECNGRRPRDGEQPWVKNQPNSPDSIETTPVSGTSTNASEVSAFTKALANVKKKRR